MEKQNKLLERFLNSYWSPIVFIITTLITIAVMWTTLQAQVTTDGKRLDIQQSKIAAMEASQTDVKVQLSGIQTDLVWIKNYLSNKLGQ